MVGTHLTSGARADDAMAVVLNGHRKPSGLAEMLRQFIEQTLAESPRKVRQARRLSGQAVFRAAEAEDVFVRIRFAGDRIELDDGGVLDPRDTLVTADFLSIAHLTSGQEGPFGLLARRRLRARFSPSQLPFLLGLVRFMRIDGTRRRAWTSTLWPAIVVAVGVGALYWYATAAR
jgi:hypothetical protein